MEYLKSSETKRKWNFMAINEVTVDQMDVNYSRSLDKSRHDNTACFEMLLALKWLFLKLPDICLVSNEKQLHTNTEIVQRPHPVGVFNINV